MLAGIALIVEGLERASLLDYLILIRTAMLLGSHLLPSEKHSGSQSHIMGADTDLARRAPGVTAPGISAPVVSVPGLSAWQCQGPSHCLLAGDTTAPRDGGHFASAIAGTYWRGLVGRRGGTAVHRKKTIQAAMIIGSTIHICTEREIIMRYMCRQQPEVRKSNIFMD